MQFALLPLIPALVSSHPALLEFIRGSTASIINMGARARVGETSILLAVFLGIPSLMMFDWAFWWAGRRWGDQVFVWMTGGPGPRTDKRLARLHRLEARFGPFAVVLAYVLPIPSALVYAAVGDGGMRLWVFLILDFLGTLLWTALLAGAGWLPAARRSTSPTPSATTRSGSRSPWCSPSRSGARATASRAERRRGRGNRLAPCRSLTGTSRT